MKIDICEKSFSPWALLQEYEQEVLDPLYAGQYGAATVFSGTMREFNEGDGVTGMLLEHYPGMTDRYLEKISAEAAARWELLDTLIVHRVGLMMPNDPIVLVAAWSAHRGEAFEAARYLIEALKSRAPFWKKEQLEEGERWVAHNTPA
ncbi:MAG: molybdenum cofactor biosynthesis protein MoaE [Gammaproteobacteria bacterium]|jgi:molybdopterin synthase catalytic subunit|nr:molybdenum cofactor biosynthesis protein MoaE [Gammaproteobacteria bacterium]MBT7308553.1 molybdenum cofactor biosynthesis protein MoaE [Gammaproteobacteria bacterium]